MGDVHNGEIRAPGRIPGSSSLRCAVDITYTSASVENVFTRQHFSKPLKI